MPELAQLILNAGLATAIAAVFVWASTVRETRHAAERTATETWIRSELQTTISDNTALLAKVTQLLADSNQATLNAITATTSLTHLLATHTCPFAKPPTP